MKVCNEITVFYYPNGEIVIETDGKGIDASRTDPGQSLPGKAKILRAVNLIGFLLCIFLPFCGLGTAGILFYHMKLKTPIAVLRDGTERILRQDLDFAVAAESKDELGELCRAFETMRSELLKTNQELWQQAEERKRLNAAFSHDLRNPVTILKGTVKLIRQGKQDDQAIDRLERYTLRIENYIEAMSSIQRLEQIPVRQEEYACAMLREEIEDTVKALAPSLAYEIYAPEEGAVWVDHGIFLNILENLVGNASRFARERLKIRLELESELLILSVWDDGCGYPEGLVRNGPRPFGKMQEETDHLGMGLYSCNVLCMKHGGELILKNSEHGGAAPSAVLLCKS